MLRLKLKLRRIIIDIDIVAEARLFVTFASIVAIATDNARAIALSWSKFSRNVCFLPVGASRTTPGAHRRVVSPLRRAQNVGTTVLFERGLMRS